MRLNLARTSTPPTGAPIRVLDARVVVGAGGGPEKTILRMPRHLDPRRVEMTAAYLHPAGDAGAEVLRNAADRLGCPIRLIPERGALDRAAIAEMLAVCRELDINVWHGHDYKSNLLGLYLRRHHPMKLVTTAHGWVHYTWRTRLYYAIEKRVLRWYDQVIAVSDDLADVCAAHGVRRDRITVAVNGIDADEYRRRQPRDAARAALGMMPDEVAVGFVGRLSTEKRVDQAIGLLARLAKRHPRLRLHVAGTGPHRETLEELTRYLGVSDRIRFHGWMPDTRTLYEALDVMLLPSRREGTPNAVLEAMAMGVAVAATAVGGVRELLDHGRCGVVLDPHRPTTWDEPFASLIESRQLRETLTDAARQRVVEHHNFARRTATIASVYERLFPAAGTPVKMPRPMRRAA
jgi:glycosyltransferase involved in cell wall biosynthesis